MKEKLIVSSKRHLIKLIESGCKTFDLQIEGMTVPENLKTIKYNKNVQMFFVNHHLAQENRKFFADELNNQNVTQIGNAIAKQKLIAIK